MEKKLIIPCLDVKDGRVVKGIYFENLRDVGDPVEFGKHYEEQGADELVYLDINATVEGRKTFTHIVEKIAKEIHIPFTVGGGIASLEDAERLFSVGADKVSINSAAVANPDVINQISGKYGEERLVIAIDGVEKDGKWFVTTHGGNKVSDKELIAWARECEERGAGSLLFTSKTHDGTKTGYPCDIFAQLKSAVSIPIIASGGAGSIDDIAEVLTSGKADAALAASIFHFGEITIPQLKADLLSNTVDSLVEEVGRIVVVRHLGMTSLNHCLQTTDESFCLGSREAAGCTLMAGRSGRLTHNEQGVGIAISVHVDYLDEVAAGLALCPESLAFTAVEGCLAGGEGLFECLLVHVSHHEDLECLCVLYYTGKESVGVLAEIEVRVFQGKAIDLDSTTGEVGLELRDGDFSEMEYTCCECCISLA